MKLKHPVSSEAIPTKVQQYECRFCKQSFLNDEDLSNHIGREHSSSSSSIVAVNAYNNEDEMAMLRKFHAKSTDSAKSLNTLISDAICILNFATEQQFISKPSVASLFTEGKIEQLISYVETQYVSKSARSYSLLLTLTKMLEAYSCQPDCNISEQSITKSMRLLEHARLPLSKQKKKKTINSHNEKNISTSRKWLSSEDIIKLSQDITAQLNELDFSASASFQHARRLVRFVRKKLSWWT